METRKFDQFKQNRARCEEKLRLASGHHGKKRLGFAEMASAMLVGCLRACASESPAPPGWQLAYRKRLDANRWIADARMAVILGEAHRVEESAARAIHCLRESLAMLFPAEDPSPTTPSNTSKEDSVVPMYFPFASESLREAILPLTRSNEAERLIHARVDLENMQYEVLIRISIVHRQPMPNLPQEDEEDYVDKYYREIGMGD